MGVMKPYLDVDINGSGWQELELRNLATETRIKNIVKAINSQRDLWSVCSRSFHQESGVVVGVVSHEFCILWWFRYRNIIRGIKCNKQFHNRKGVGATGRGIGSSWTIEARDECWREGEEGSAILMAQCANMLALIWYWLPSNLTTLMISNSQVKLRTLFVSTFLQSCWP